MLRKPAKSAGEVASTRGDAGASQSGASPGATGQLWSVPVSLFRSEAMAGGSASAFDTWDGIDDIADTASLSPVAPVAAAAGGATADGAQPASRNPGDGHFASPRTEGGAGGDKTDAKASEREAKRRAKERAKAEKALAKAEARAKRNTRGRKAAFAAAGVAVILLAGGYGYGVYTYSNQFFPNTTFGTVDVSNRTYADAASMLRESEKDYTLAVSGQGIDFRVTPAESGMQVNVDGVVDKARDDMNPWAWPVEYFADHSLADTFGVTLDDSALSAYISGQIQNLNATRTPSEDARIEYSQASHSFEVVPETYGDQIEESKVLEAVSACMLSRENECAVGENAVIKPKVYAKDDDIVSGAKAANDMLGVDIALTSKLKPDGPAATLNSDKVAQWISFNEARQPALSDEAIATWAANVATPLTNIGTTRSYTRPDGKQVTIGGGTFGCWTSSDATAKTVREAIDQKKTGDVELERVCAGDQAPEGSPTEWGAYVDVDITEQYARYYDAKGEIIWESGIISGNPTDGHATPGGIWYLNRKQPGMTLLGRRLPSGEREYETWVDYWMPFEADLVGFHDAPWQASGNFGSPTAYRSVGSHGCINLPSDAAARLYSMITVGTPVIVHG